MLTLVVARNLAGPVWIVIFRGQFCFSEEYV